MNIYQRIVLILAAGVVIWVTWDIQVGLRDLQHIVGIVRFLGVVVGGLMIFFALGTHKKKAD
ncbi:hypothetical protein KAX35_09505 [candidate division WOR-3 bacterium]|nr:hypothetical protein [candidate division WOR-3 bacterium]